jgi:hypothetical protein
MCEKLQINKRLLVQIGLNFRGTCFFRLRAKEHQSHSSIFSSVTKLLAHVAGGFVACASLLVAISVCTEAYFLLRPKEKFYVEFPAVPLFRPTFQVALSEVTLGTI